MADNNMENKTPRQLREEQNRAELTAALKRQAEELKLQDQKRQTAQQAVQDQVKAREEQAYQGWAAVPAELASRTQLNREGLRIPEGVKPVAEVLAYRPGQRGKTFYDLYRREDAVPSAKDAPETSSTEDEKKERRVRSRARKMLPLLYNDLKGSTGKTRQSIEGEIDDLERQLEEQGLAYDHETRQVYVLAEDEDEAEEE